MVHHELPARQSTGQARAVRWYLALALALLFGASPNALAQLSGEYTVGGTGDDFPTIEAAITAVSATGVGGAVTFRLNAGTHTPPTGGYVLPAVASMSSTNTVTFKPKANASVSIDGTLTTAVITFSGGDYWIFDGSNAANGTTRDLKIINRGTAEPAILFEDGATYNAVRNANIVSAATSTSDGAIKIYNSTTALGGNSNNEIRNNTIGDSTGTIRSAAGIYMYGTSTAKNSANLIIGNDFINLGYSTTSLYGVYVSSYNDYIKIIGNRISVASKGSWTGSAYGVYYSNSYGQLDTIALNRIWDLISNDNTKTIYGIYLSSVASGQTITVHTNMVSVYSDGAATLAALYSGTSNTATEYIYNNSFVVSGANGVTDNSYGVYFSGTTGPTIYLKNNTIVNTRTGTGTNTNRAIHRTATNATLTSDFNVLFVSGAGTVTGTIATTAYADLAAWQAAGFDANSAFGDPQFVDVRGGDLHISPSQPTPVESRGTPIAGLGTDFDGNTRSTTTPDVGADEGTFTLLRSNDLEAVSFVTPTPGTQRPSGIAFQPVVVVGNPGVNGQSGIPVRLRFINSAGTIVYEDVQATPAMSSGATAQLTFSANGSVLGSTSLTADIYTMELVTLLPRDDYASNDRIVGVFNIRDPLSGTYTIDAGSAASRNYPSFTEAIAALNDLGMAGAVTFEVASGSYTGASETFPLTFGAINGLSATQPITFRPATGATVSLGGVGANSIVVLDQADYVTFDGSNTVGGTTRDWTITNSSTAESVIRLTNGASYNVFRNLILIGAATSSSDAIVKIYGSTTGVGNSYNTIASNTIGDVTGATRSVAGVYMYGSSSAYNVGNTVRDNDIINFASGSSSGYGVYVSSYNQRVRISYNRISIPIKGSTTGGAYGVYWSNSNAMEDTIDHNRMWDVTTADNTDLFRGIYISSINGTYPILIANNMIAFTTDGASTVAGVYFSSSTTGASTIMYGNSIYIGGSNAGSDASYGFYLSSSGSATLRNNVIVNERMGTTAGANRAIYRAGTTGRLYSNYNHLYAGGTGASVGYVSSNRVTLADWQAAGYDTNSVFGPVPFVSTANGDLHVDTMLVFAGESMGVRTPIPADFDGELRDAATPDPGADEGNFNGGGLRIVTPNGGEQIPINYELDLTFVANRPLPVTVQFSVDGGATWMTSATVVPTVRDTNVITIATPDVVTDAALLRVISQRNQWEADTTDRAFSLVHPEFWLTTPNGGERLVPTDTFRVRWTNDFLPPTLRAAMDYSSDGGATWTRIAADLVSPNLPTQNYLDWIVPDAPGNATLVRVGVARSTNRDTSDATFTILPKPVVNLLSLNAGQRLFVGEKVSVDWSTISTERVRLEYSTDGGTTWSNLINGGKLRLPSGLESYEWTIPATPSDNVLVRVVNDERTRFVDVSDMTLQIVRGELTVVTPNGGEKYEMTQPVTVRFDAPHSTTLHLEYSPDGGASWQSISRTVDASIGSFTFTPPAVPTRRALVRLTDEARLALIDVSDATFEIMEAPSISIVAPGAGEQIMRGTIYPISWMSTRVQNVNIDFSPSAGAAGTWRRVASNIVALQGTFNWTVPNENTSYGRIRISEVGGPIVAEAGDFSIVAPVLSVRIVRPNGGEVFTAGDPVPVSWTSAGVTSVDLAYSSDNGTTWQTMATGLPSTQVSFAWTAPSVPGTQYRVRVSSGALSDASDATFEIARRLVPSLAVTLPNGGERYMVDSSVVVTWLAIDVTGTANVEYSLDAGGSWTAIGTAPATTGALSWTIPDTVSDRALVRVTVDVLNDVSDAPFSIERPPVPTIALTYPNESEIVWFEGSLVNITWTSENLGSVDIRLSTDDGATWSTTVASSVPAAAGTYQWRVPHLADSALPGVRVLVAGSGSGVPSDTSDQPLEFRPVVNGADDAVAGVSALRVLGNFPNPFTGTTEVRWQQRAAAAAELVVFDHAGAVVLRIDCGVLPAGTQSRHIDAGTLPAGAYHYQLRVGTETGVGTMIVVR